MKCFFFPCPDPDNHRVEDGVEVRGAVRHRDLAEQDAEAGGETDSLRRVYLAVLQ